MKRIKKQLNKKNKSSILVWRKRITGILLTTVLITGILPLYPLPVEASAVPIDAEVSAEIFVLLWELMLDGLVAGGAADVVADYRSNELTFQSFMGTLHDTLMAGSPGLGTVTLSDGTQVSLDAFVSGIADGTITVPDVDVKLKGVNTWFVYDNMEHWSASQPPFDRDPKDPVPEKPGFSRIKSFILGSGVFTALSATFSSLFNGEIEGVDPSIYFDVDDSLCYSGQIGEAAYGYWYHGTVGPRYTYGGHYSVSWYGSNQHSYCALYSDNSIYFYGGRYDGNGDYLDFSSASIGDGIIGINGSSNYTLWYHLNFPVFGDKDSVVHFLSTGDYTGCLNLSKEKLDYSLLLSAIPTTLSPITGKRLSASSMLDLYKKMKNGYQTEIKPQLEFETDTDKNTQIYIEVITDAAEEVGNETVTDPDPEVKPDPENPKPNPKPETETEISDYQVDLRKIFPFCIPFDFVALLNALDADPVAPCFTFPVVIPALDYREDIRLDLSVFDDVAEVIRICEKVSFLIFLMFATYKVIRW